MSHIRASEVPAVRQLFLEVSATFERLSSSDYAQAVGNAVDLLCAAFQAGAKLLVFGNGGSASDAQHICGELVGRFLLERPGLPAIALTENAAVLTAWANDYDFDSVFARQIQALGRPGDVAWSISTSGTSPNVVAGLAAARAAGLRTIAMSGAGGGSLVAEVLLLAPASGTARIPEVHVVTYHAICAAVEQRLAPPTAAAHGARVSA